MHFYIENPWENPSSKERLELVFEDRFKQYGAYVIRKQYSRNTVVAMFVASGLVAACAGLVLLPKPTQPSSIKVSGVPKLPPPDSIAYFDPREILGGGGAGSENPGPTNEYAGLLAPEIDPLSAPAPMNLPGGHGPSAGEEGLSNPFGSNGGPGNEGNLASRGGSNSASPRLPSAEC